MAKVRLEFEADVSEDEAWDIADSLEKAAIKRGYREVNGYVVTDGGRGSVLGTEENPVQSDAETLEHRTGGGPTQFGGPDASHLITLGDEDGRMG